MFAAGTFAVVFVTDDDGPSPARRVRQASASSHRARAASYRSVHFGFAFAFLISHLLELEPGEEGFQRLAEVFAQVLGQGLGEGPAKHIQITYGQTK